jgi:hypothetical protein
MAKTKKNKLSNYRIISNKDQRVISTFLSTAEAARSTLKFFRQKEDCRLD